MHDIHATDGVAATRIASDNRALLKIEDDLIRIRAHAHVMHLAFHSLEEDGKGHSALAQSIWATGTAIEEHVDRIREKLGEKRDASEVAVAVCGCNPAVATAEAA
jgi:hypothetical protein